MKELLYLKDDQLKEFIEKIFISYRETFFDAKKILATDPYVKIDENLKPIEEVINKSNLIILCSPHKIYKKLNLKGKSVIDIWGFLSSKKNNCKFI